MAFQKLYEAYVKSNNGERESTRAAFKTWTSKYQGGGTFSSDEKPQEDFDTKVLIPGKIYTCFYAGMDELKEWQFVDHWPVLFSVGQRVKDNVVYEMGIDLNLVPIKVRRYVIGRLYDFYEDTITYNADRLVEGQDGKKKIVIDFEKAQRILQGTGFERAYVSLIREKMGKIKVVDYTDWPMTAFLYTKGIRGKGIGKIHAEYVKAMGQMGREKEEFVKRLIT